ncbi:MAG TPA: ATPase domain-containing protein [Gemmatimonadaceae bacterium]|nr:ATPase domain-containing protein [Gemmatimonadaceae bacterium]
MAKRSAKADAQRVVSTGVDGLDEILLGGLPADFVYLVEGEPGTGKTTLALQFLMAGRAAGERVMYIGLSETSAELRTVARSHDWSLDGIEIFELRVGSTSSTEEEYTIFHPAEIELQQTMDTILAAVEKYQPQRIAFDSLSEMRLLARETLRFRRQVLGLKQFFSGRGCTVLLLDDKGAPEADLQLHSLAHGVITLEHLALEYGAERRRIVVQKIRGSVFRGGFHDFAIRTGGIQIFPRIRNLPVDELPGTEIQSSGSTELDSLLGDGLVRGTSLLITGAAGTGKSVTATMFARAALEEGQRVHVYLFDERVATFRLRANALKMKLDPALKDRRLCLHQVEPTVLSPGEFARNVMDAVEKDGATMIVIDSINGYMQSMPEERLLPLQVHELLTYLTHKGVTTIMTLVQRGIFGNLVEDAADVSYLADTVILLRYFEVQGAVRQAISVVKKRSGQHERTIRECRVGPGGLRVGEPLREFQGVLTGVPEYYGGASPLMQDIPSKPKRA